MDNKLLLAKSITLLYQESKLQDKSENSADLIRTVLENVQVSEVGVGLSTTREVILALKTTILEMCDNPIDHEYDKLELLQRIRINTGDDTKLYEAIELGLDDSLKIDQARRTITNIQKSIHNHFREQQIATILNKASYSFKFEREKIKDVNQFLNDLQTQLEPLQLNSSYADPAVIGDLDIADEEGMERIFTDIQKNNAGTRVYKTGWQALNRMLDGGFRPGTMTVIGALQHKYKTGFSLSLFQHIAMYNTPLTTDTTKKPTLLRISFEDSLDLNLQFMYQSMLFDETRTPISKEELAGIPVQEMSAYVKKKLTANGWTIKMLRVEGTQWTYRSICDKIVSLTATGHAVEVLVLDYLFKVSKAGCMSSGIIGSDVNELFSRVRNFCASQNIACITPHQLSTEAKTMLRSGMSESDFVKNLVNRGFWENSKSLDVVVDNSLYVHLFKHNKETYFSVQGDKARGMVIPEEDKYFLLRFPKAPRTHVQPAIPPDIMTEDSSIAKISSAASNAADELFNIG